VLKQTVSTSEYREKVRRHRISQSLDTEPAVEEIRSPFDVEKTSSGLLRIEINANFSAVSFAALALEVDSICKLDRNGVWFDFGRVDRLDGLVLTSLDQLMHELHQYCGGVKASAENDKLIRQIHFEHESSGGLAFLALLLEEAKTG